MQYVIRLNAALNSDSLPPLVKQQRVLEGCDYLVLYFSMLQHVNIIMFLFRNVHH